MKPLDLEHTVNNKIPNMDEFDPDLKLIINGQNENDKWQSILNHTDSHYNTLEI